MSVPLLIWHSHSWALPRYFWVGKNYLLVVVPLFLESSLISLVSIRHRLSARVQIIPKMSAGTISYLGARKMGEKECSLHPEMIFHNTRIIVVWSISHWFFSPCAFSLLWTWIHNIVLSLRLLDPFAFKRMNMEKVFRKTISFPRYWISIFKVHATFSSIIFLLPPLSPIFQDCLETCLIGELIAMPELGRSVTFECLASATSFD